MNIIGRINSAVHRGAAIDGLILPDQGRPRISNTGLLRESTEGVVGIKSYCHRHGPAVTDRVVVDGRVDEAIDPV